MRIANETQHIEQASVQSVADIEKIDDQGPEDIQKKVGIQNDPEWIRIQRRYLWKLDCILLPAVSLLYFFEYLDRGNVANAKLYGLARGHRAAAPQGIGPGTKSLSPSRWQLVVMIFYVGLVLFQVPGCWGYRVFPPSKVRDE